MTELEGSLKLSIFNFGISASHDLITNVGLNDSPSISDFDAFVFDAGSVRQGALTHESLPRKQNEIHDLLLRKGGIVICLLRQAQPLGLGPSPDSYSILDTAANTITTRVRNTLRFGEGLQMKTVPDAKGASAEYLRILQKNLRWVAYLNADPASFADAGGAVLSVNSVGQAVAVEFTVGPGRICFVPIPSGALGERVGSALVRVIEAHYGGPAKISAPEWVVSISVPGAAARDPEIAQLKERKEQIALDIERLEKGREELLNYRVLLYGYGKSVLEPAVRSAFRLVGFEVPEPEKYCGEWDAELLDPKSKATAICEVEGSEGPVDVDKYRQLLDYTQAEALEGRDHKGILVGNGYPLSPLDAAQRQNQFSEHSLRGAKKNSFCLLPTTELFKAVCAVLEAPNDTDLKTAIRDSIISIVGPWTFARDVVAENNPTNVSAEAV